MSRLALALSPGAAQLERPVNREREFDLLSFKDTLTEPGLSSENA